MKLGVISGNSLRHKALGAYLNQYYEVTQYLEEPKPSQNQKSQIIEEYFLKVKKSEDFIFGKEEWSNDKVKKIFLQKGEINNLISNSEDLFKCDIIVVFGSSIIKDPLFSKISDKILINLHMGISPEYIGSACNFWAMFDNNIQYVGGTIQTLSKSLDMGNTLKYCYPELDVESFNPFNFSMQAVETTIKSIPLLVDNIDDHLLKMIEPDSSKLIRNSKIKDFDEKVINQFYLKKIDLENINKRN